MTDFAELIRQSAARLGADPLDLANVISYETIGTFDPKKRGGKDDKYVGLIQMGPEERRRYGGGTDQDFETNLLASERYLKARGFKPGMGLLDLYSTINAGSPGHYNASDGKGTVKTHVAEMLGSHRQKAANLLGTDYRAPGTAKALDHIAGSQAQDQLSGGRSPMGASTIIGGMSNEPMYARQSSAGLQDVNDDEYWSTVAPETVEKPAPIATPLPVGRPTTALDTPVTENTGVATAGAPALQKNVASRLVYKNGTPELELYDPSVEANAKIEPLPEDQAMIQGKAESSTLFGGDESDDDLSQFEQSPGVSPDDDDLSQFEESSPTTVTAPETPENYVQPEPPPGYVLDPHTNQMVDISQVPSDSSDSLRSLANKVLLGQGYNLAGGLMKALGNDPNQVDALKRQFELSDLKFKTENPGADLAGSIVGPIPATITGMGIAGRGLTAAGTGLANALPATAGVVSATGKLLSGQLGSWAGNAWDKIAKMGNLAALGGIEGAVQGAAQTGLTPESIGQDAAFGAAIGAGLGPLFGGVGHLLTKDLVADYTAGAKDVFKQASQIFTNRTALPFAGRLEGEGSNLQNLHSRLIPAAVENRQLRAWTDQAMEFAGSHHKTATLPNIEDNAKAIGRHFDQVIDAAHIGWDQTVDNTLTSLESTLGSNMHGGPKYNALRTEIGRIRDDIKSNNGRLNPELYQSIIQSTSTLGKMIKSPDGEVAQYATDVRNAITDWVDRGYTQTTGGSPMKIHGLGTGTPRELYNEASRRWKMNETIRDSVENTGNHSGVLDPEAFGKASIAGKRNLSPNPNDPQRVMVQTAAYMPRVTRQGTAVVTKEPMTRWISNIINFGGAAAAASSVASAALRIGGSSVPAVLGLAGGAAGVVAMRNKYLANRLLSSDLTNELMGDTAALAKQAGKESVRRNILTSAGIGVGNQLTGR